VHMHMRCNAAHVVDRILNSVADHVHAACRSKRCLCVVSEAVHLSRMLRVFDRTSTPLQTTGMCASHCCLLAQGGVGPHVEKRGSWE
jgi:hypothetical protein